MLQRNKLLPLLMRGRLLRGRPFLIQNLTYFIGNKSVKSCNPKSASHQGLRWKKCITAIHQLRLMVILTPGANPIEMFTPKDKFFKSVLKHENKHKKMLVVMLGQNTLNYLQDYIFLYHSNSNLGSLFYTALRCKKFFSIGP